MYRYHSTLLLDQANSVTGCTSFKGQGQKSIDCSKMLNQMQIFKKNIKLASYM